MDDKTQNRRIHKRVQLQDHLKVTMRSIGGEISYHLKTKNLSYNGLFLDFENPGRFPFTPASIMEVWVEFSADKKLFFNGKMARVVFPSDAMSAENGAGIAIRIVLIDDENSNLLKEFVDKNYQENVDHSTVEGAA